MRKLVLIASLFCVASVQAQNCSELFISEYVEGWSNNKAIEIYNPTAASINLSNYFLVRYDNGNTAPTAVNMIQLSGTVPAYDVYVAVLDKRDPNGTGQEAPIWDSLEARGDGFYCPDYNVSKTMYFNGNDAVALFKGNVSSFSNAVAVDIFGKIGEDPGTGWTTESPYVGVGAIVTKDHSLIRHKDIEKGVTNPMIQEFNALAEWDSLPAVVNRLDSAGNIIYGQSGNPVVDGNWYSLGWHECNCSPYLSVKEESKELQNVKIFPNPSEDGFLTVMTNKSIASMEILNSLGQVIATKSNTPENSISHLFIENSGFYFLKVTTKQGQVSTQRFIVK